jgi:L-alanine-DL-glutamate epimerase-like enolase superfamily enzyme
MVSTQRMHQSLLDTPPRAAYAARRMKITDVRATHVRVEDPNMTLFDGSYDDCIIVVETDEGITGIGEVESLAPAVIAFVHARDAHNHARGLRNVLLGQDPRNPEALWQEMYDATDYVGRRGVAMHAIGGIDIALWDIAGKASGKPVGEMLGGIRHDRLPAYGTIYPMARTTAQVARQVRDAMAMNLRNIKFAADPWWLDDIKLTGSLLKAARTTLGDSGKIIIDAALSYRTAGEGLRLYDIYREINIHFLEAPLPLDDFTGHARMARQGIPLGVGDLGLTHVDEFIEYMERGGASVLQPDITMVGGFTGLKKIAKAADERGKRVVTHGYKTNIEIAANCQFLASRPTAELLEYSTSKSPLRWKMTNELLPVESDGNVVVPRRPGIGVTLNQETFKKYSMQWHG